MAVSCSFLDEDPTIIVSNGKYETVTDAQYALNGVYGAINSYEFYGQYYSLEFSLNDDTCFYGSSNKTQTVMKILFDSGTDQIYKMWTKIYAGIRNANTFLEAIEQSDVDQDGQMRNQAKFLRAFYYYNLAQCWGDVPLRTKSTKSYEDAQCAATPQEDVIDWVIAEMRECISKAPDTVEGAPYKVTRTAMQGFLARVCLFKAGATVDCSAEEKRLAYKEAMELTDAVMKGGKHQLHPDYPVIFQNMIGDKYDTEYYESMWEADFVGNRSTADYYSNGRIGELNGLQSTGSSNFSAFNCNYSYGMFRNTPKIWDLYMTEDRVPEEEGLAYITDKRQEWNIPPYNYAGYSSPTAPTFPYGGDPSDVRDLIAGIDKTPYVVYNQSTSVDPLLKIGGRNTGKFRREVCYEGQQESMALYNGINFPILRYSDVVLMYAEAKSEYEGVPSQEAYNAVKSIRDRAGIKTKPFSEYSQMDDFRQFVRNERARELCFEALRKYDLIRWGIYTEEMNKLAEQALDPRWSFDGLAAFCSQVGAAVQPKHVLLPIPAIELGVNGLLKQNELW